MKSTRFILIKYDPQKHDLYGDLLEEIRYKHPARGPVSMREYARDPRRALSDNTIQRKADL